jgi:ubiquinone/menaquinone biosynthesis C-methylase UbiE
MKRALRQLAKQYDKQLQNEQKSIMSSYTGKHAEYYDIFYRDKDYAAEAEFVDQCIKRFGLPGANRLLELACGTGNHAFALETAGYQLLATDYSEDLLKEADKKAKARGSRVAFQLADMRELQLDADPFDAVICLFDSIGYVQSDEAINAVFQNVQRNLRPGGLFIFEFWHAPAMLKSYDPVRVRRWSIPEGKLLRISSTELLEGTSLAEVSYEIYELRKDLSYETIEESQVNRFFTVEEMKRFLKANQFEGQAWFNGYSWSENIDDECWHVLAVAQRNS